MRQYSAWSPKPFFSFLLIVIFFASTLGFRLPSPIFRSTHLAKAVLLAIVPLVFLSTVNLCKKLSLRSKRIIYIILIYLISVSISVWFSLFFRESFRSLLNLIVNIGVFLAIIVSKPNQTQKKLFLILITILATVSSLYSIMTAFNPSAMQQVSSVLFPPEVVLWQQFDLHQGKILPLTPIFMYVPLILYQLFSSHKKKLVVYIYGVVFILVEISLFLTNWRSLFISNLFAVLVYLRLNKLIVYHKIVPVLMMSVIALGLAVGLSSHLGVNIIERFLLKRETDVSTAVDRLRLFRQGIKIFSYYPYSGTGLGTYQFILDPTEVTFPSASGEKLSDVVTTGSAHNMWITSLTETGLVGTIPLALLISVFLFQDYSLLKKTGADPRRKLAVSAYIVSSWIFLVANLTENVLFTSSFLLFFVLRGMVFVEGVGYK